VNPAGNTNLPYPAFSKRGDATEPTIRTCVRAISPFGKGGLRGIFLYGAKDLFGYGIGLQQDLPIVEAQYS
jgi:hypothetical protein